MHPGAQPPGSRPAAAIALIAVALLALGVSAAVVVSVFIPLTVNGDIGTRINLTRNADGSLNITFIPAGDDIKIRYAVFYNNATEAISGEITDFANIPKNGLPRIRPSTQYSICVFKRDGSVSCTGGLVGDLIV